MGKAFFSKTTIFWKGRIAKNGRAFTPKLTFRSFSQKHPFSAEREARRGGSQTLLQQANGEQWDAQSDHPECLRGVASGGGGNEIGTNHATPVGVRSNKYLNNIIAEDHRRVKHRVGPTHGFRRFDTAAITICGIELAAKIRKQQFKIGKLQRRPKSTPGICAAVLAA